MFVAEFESWYNESFLLPDEVLAIFKEGGPIRPGLIPVDKALSLVSNAAAFYEAALTESLAYLNGVRCPRTNSQMIVPADEILKALTAHVMQ